VSVAVSFFIVATCVLYSSVYVFMVCTLAWLWKWDYRSLFCQQCFIVHNCLSCREKVGSSTSQMSATVTGHLLER